jgi:hypothetical protein
MSGLCRITRAALTIGAIVLATGIHAQDGKDQDRIKLPPRTRMPEESRIPDEKGPRPWMCKGERQAVEIMVDALYAQARKHHGMALAKDYALAVVFARDYRECWFRSWPRRWDVPPLPGSRLRAAALMTCSASVVWARREDTGDAGASATI